MPLIEKLVTIEDFMKKYYGKPCEEGCSEFYGRNVGVYNHVQRKTDKQVILNCSIFGCERKIHLDHYLEAPKQGTINGFEDEIKKFMSKRSSLPIQDSDSHIIPTEGKRFIEEGESIQDRIIFLAKLCPEDYTVNFNGFCRYCFKEVPQKIERNQLWTSCEICASIIADSAD